MIWCETSSNGVVSQVGECPDTTEASAFSHFTGSIHLDCPTVNVGDKFTNGVVTPKPLQPSLLHIFDDVSFSWVLPSGFLDTAKAQAKARITSERNRAELAGFTAYGKVFDSDASSLQRIAIVVQAASAIGTSFSVDWTCADNSVITLDYAQVIALPALMAQEANALHVRARTLKANIDAATTLEEINLITW